MPDGETTDTVSREAHDRVKHENEKLKADIAQLRPVVEQTYLTDTAYEHFKSKADVKDPYGVAKAAARDAMFVGVDKETLPTKLDEWLDGFKAVFGSPSPPDDADGGSTPPAAPPPPGSARSAPSPANSGGDPKPEPLTMQSPEVQEMRRRGDRDGMRQLVKEGRLKFSPDNPYSQQQ